MITDRKGRQLPLSERLHPAHTALLIVDVQNDFVEPDGVCGREGNDLSSARPMIRRLSGLIQSARDAEVLVVYIQAIYDEPVLGRPLAEQYARRGFLDSMCLTGSKGANFVDEVRRLERPGEVTVQKHRYSPFGGSNIDLVLRSNGIKTVVVTGIVTEVCVESTARDAFFYDYYVVEAADCVSSYFAERDAASKTALDRSFARIVTADEIAKIWRDAGEGTRNWHPDVKERMALVSLEEKLNPAHTALLLFGLQNDFVSESGALGRNGANLTRMRSMLPRLRSLLLKAREAGVLVIHVEADYRDLLQAAGPRVQTTAADRQGEASWRELCQPGTWGTEFADGFSPSASECVATVSRFGGLADSNLGLLLRSNDIRTAVIAGVETNCAVESTVRDAAARDHYVIVPEDCVATQDDQLHLHTASLETMGRYFATVTRSDAIAAAWKSRRGMSAEPHVDEPVRAA